MNLTIPQLLFTWTVLAIGINVFLVGCYAAWKFGDWAYDKLTTPKWQQVGPVGIEAELAIINRIQEKKPPAVMHPANPSILEHIDAELEEVRKHDKQIADAFTALGQLDNARETARRQALSHATTCMPYGGEYTSHGSTIMPPSVNPTFPYESVTKDHVDAMYPQRFDYFRHK